jgi:mannosyl-3-phosphoglycerate synthase
MRIELPREVERLGAVRFGGLQKVFELDSGLRSNPSSIKKGSSIAHVPYEAQYEIQKKMAIVVPVFNERLKLVEGVLCGIPHKCLIIIVSNSPRSPVDRFQMEQDALRDFCIFTNKNALIVHQKDSLMAKAFEKTNYSSILNKKGEIRDGKAEGMLIGTMLGWLAGKKYIGFVDADNYFPGAVEEYIKEYASGFFLGRSNHIMVRIAWHSKPKIAQSKLFFRKWGRVSEQTNQTLNRLISSYTGYETDIIKTGNAGEHALTIDLATCLDYSAGYSIEPYHIINLIEKFGCINEAPPPEVMKRNVEVYQIESRNPHLHETGDKDHIDQMISMASQVIYHSPICPDEIRKTIVTDLIKRKLIASKHLPPKPHYFPALSNIDRNAFLRNLKSAPYACLIKDGNL